MALKPELFDLLVIGGGINGVGIAADAAGRGLSVLLCEMGDLGSATSSNSSKLIHGGLRYLELFEFRLVREALAEREILLRNAPHIIWPLRFILPYHSHLRPYWVIRAGLFLYDHLVKRTTLPASNTVKFTADSPLSDEITRGFEYSDAWVDDARLVILNALAAQKNGALIKPRTQCVNAVRKEQYWSTTLEDKMTGQTETVHSRAIVNAAGPWASSLFNDIQNCTTEESIRLVKGSHIIVPRLHNEPQGYILQNRDNRIVFVIPYEEKFSLIGTTDLDYSGDPAEVAIEQSETDYLIDITNQYFKKQIRSSEVIHSYSGVRPLLNSSAEAAQSVSRDYKFELNDNGQGLPLISVFGGKITTYRKLSETAIDSLCDQYFPESGARWTSKAALPGGNFSSHKLLLDELMSRSPWLPNNLAYRYVRSYGTLSYRLLEGINTLESMGLRFSDDLYEAEVLYLINNEWAQTVEDMLWRRTKLGLHMTKEQTTALSSYLNKHFSKPNTA